MPVARELDEALDGLAPLGEITSRPLFGGHGIYGNDVIFGLLCRGRLYFKVDEESKCDYLAGAWGRSDPTRGRP